MQHTHARLQRHLRLTLASLTGVTNPCSSSTNVADSALPVPPHGGNAHRPTVTGVQGMVACAHPLAAQAGMRILMQGGNAIDAGAPVVRLAVATVASIHQLEGRDGGRGAHKHVRRTQ